VLLCFVDPILGKSQSRCHSLIRGPGVAGFRTLHLKGGPEPLEKESQVLRFEM